MILNIEGLDVCFPYDYIYPEQLRYMTELKRILDAKGHGVLEMPTGTGKTVSLLALITSYQYASGTVGKLVYCTRTVPEMDKVMDELKRLFHYRKQHLGEGAARFIAVSLSSRRNMCIHPTVSQGTTREAVDAGCRSLTASWVRSSAIERMSDDTANLCPFFENLENGGAEEMFAPGVRLAYPIDMTALHNVVQYCDQETAKKSLCNTVLLSPHPHTRILALCGDNDDTH